MSRYRKIDQRIWNDEKFRTLSDAAKLVFFMLLTHPNMTMLGAMRSTAAGLAEELGWQVEAFRQAFAEVLRQGMSEHDAKAHLIALPHFLRYNRPESPNVVKSWATALDMLPECALKTRVVARCKDFVGGMSDGFREALPEAFRRPMANQEQEQEQEQIYSAPAGAASNAGCSTSSRHAPVTQPVTRDNTANQTPDPHTHSSGATAPERAPGEPAEPASADAARARTVLGAGTLPTSASLPEDLDPYGMPGRQTVEQMERELWDAGKALLMRASVPKQQAGAFIGGLIAKWNDRQMVIEVVRAAIVERPADPKGWMTAACQSRAGARRTSVSNLTERRVATMAGLKNTGAQHGNSNLARGSSFVDAEARVVNGN